MQSLVVVWLFCRIHFRKKVLLLKLSLTIRIGLLFGQYYSSIRFSYRVSLCFLHSFLNDVSPIVYQQKSIRFSLALLFFLLKTSSLSQNDWIPCLSIYSYRLLWFHANRCPLLSMFVSKCWTTFVYSSNSSIWTTWR